MASSKVQQDVQAILDKACAEVDILPGAVFIMMDRSGQCLAKAASGVRGVDKLDQPMTTDTAFAGFSCVKLIVAIAILQLVEQGKLELDAPVDLILPEIADVQMLDGSTPKRKITMRMLLSHTSGFAYPFFNEGIKEWSRTNQMFNGDDWQTYKQPLVAQPGEDWNYGIGLEWAFKALEKVTGQSIGEYCKEYIFDPLGCRDITFNSVSPQCKDRLASMHSRLPSGKLVRIDHPPGFRGVGQSRFGGSYCVITPEDYIKIVFLLINEGKGLNGVAVLEPSSVNGMFKDQLENTPAGARKPLERTISAAIPTLTNEVTLSPGVEKGWSFAGLLTKEGLPSGRSANSVWWAGLGNLYWMADREKGVVNVIMSQYFPFYDHHTLDPYRAAEKTVYDNLS